MLPRFRQVNHGARLGRGAVLVAREEVQYEPLQLPQTATHAVSVPHAVEVIPTLRLSPPSPPSHKKCLLDAVPGSCDGLERRKARAQGAPFDHRPRDPQYNGVSEQTTALGSLLRGPSANPPRITEGISNANSNFFSAPEPRAQCASNCGRDQRDPVLRRRRRRSLAQLTLQRLAAPSVAGFARYRSGDRSQSCRS